MTPRNCNYVFGGIFIWYKLLSISACNVGSNTWPIKSSTGQEDVEIFFGEFWGKFNPYDFTNDHNKYQL